MLTQLSPARRPRMPTHPRSSAQTRVSPGRPGTLSARFRWEAGQCRRYDDASNQCRQRSRHQHHWPGGGRQPRLMLHATGSRRRAPLISHIVHSIHQRPTKPASDTIHIIVTLQILVNNLLNTVPV